MGFRLKPPHQTDLERNHILLHALSIKLSSAAKEQVPGSTLGQCKSAGLYQPQGSYADLHLVRMGPTPPHAAQQPPQHFFSSLGHVNTPPPSVKTGRELKLSSALAYLCCFNYRQYPWLEQT